MGAKVASTDERIASLASRQHGVVSVRQLRELGVGRREIGGRVRVGRLYRLHQGVYAVGHVGLSPRGRWMAAVLACRGGGVVDPAGGKMAILDYWGAALSRRAAASLWEMLPSRDGPVDVSIRGYGGRARRAGIRLHRSLTFLPSDVTLRHGIPVTTPARTIADLRRAASRHGGAAIVSPRELRRAIRQAGVLGLSIGDEVGRDRTRSDLERDFLRLCRRHRLPSPEVNVCVGPYLVDFLWRDRRLIVETDGYAYHRGRAAFEDDRTRDLALRGLGYEVQHIADRQVSEEPERIAGVLRDRLAGFRSGGREARHVAP